jgi:hypothetical protein
MGLDRSHLDIQYSAYFLLDPLKFAVRYAISGRAWDLVVDQKVSETKAVKVLIK